MNKSLLGVPLVALALLTPFAAQAHVEGDIIVRAGAARRLDPGQPGHARA